MKRAGWALAVAALLATTLLTFGSGGLSLEDSGEALVRAAKRRATGEDSTAVVRRLYEGPWPDTWGTDLTPDCRYLTQTDWETGDLAIQDLLTGEIRRVTNHGEEGNSDAYSEMAVVSPDGDEIAYLWFNDDSQYEIRVVEMDGSGSRLLLPPTPDLHDWPGLLDWSPDGQNLLLLLYRDEGSALALLSTEDGSLETLSEMGVGLDAERAWFSPDGRFIAFDEDSKPPSPGLVSPDNDVFLIPAGGGETVPLLRGPANDVVLGWEADGRAILFSSDRELTEGVWRLPMVDGRVAGDPELIKGDLWGLDPIGVCQSRVFYGITTETTTLYTAGVDLEEGRLGTPMAVEEGPRLLRSMPTWSPDGRQLAYTQEGLPGPGRNEIQLVIRSLPGERPRTLSLPIPNVLRFWWSADGRGLILASPTPTKDQPGWRGLYTFDLETGKCDPIEGSEGLPWWSPLSRDRRIAFYSRWLEDPNRFMARDLASGTDRDLVSLDTIWGNVRVTGHAYLSPDDRWLAVWVAQREAPGTQALAVISTETGEVRELHRQDVSTSVDRMCGRLSWTPDAGAVLFARPDPLSDGCTLFRVSVQGGEPTPVLTLPPHRFMSFTPDGSRVAFDSGEFRGEIWMLTRLEEAGGET